MRAYIALGSNLGDRAGYLLLALSALSRLPQTHLLRLSPIYETDPIGPPQPPYLNLVAEVETALPPRALLQHLLDIERALGRVRKEPLGPRTIDLDLLLYGDLVLEEEGLTLPHPRLHQRAFVLVPLADLAPDLLHPRLGQRVAHLLEAVGREGVRPLVL
ncbi:2-amino-4-hydroxy-6-hydroxymethyldihydropteridine diphosphokinase [Thermus sp.]|uniref:2-amino-4-hydroxy-6- hydroxymethyldihydropteridine diphosphokinase n=1 Tax=Thermus sp. TaxID=275 RepID=UPI00307CFF7D